MSEKPPFQFRPKQPNPLLQQEPLKITITLEGNQLKLHCNKPELNQLGLIGILSNLLAFNINQMQQQASLIINPNKSNPQPSTFDTPETPTNGEADKNHNG